jgi:hypothetical protein
LQITLPGTSNPVTFNKANTITNTKENYTNYYESNEKNIKFNGPNGAIATIVNDNNGQSAIKVETSNGVYYYNTSGTLTNTSTNTSTQYYGSTGDPIQQSPHSRALQGNNQYYESYGNNNNGVYNDTLPQGIPRNQIPNGQEDLYILKSEIVPPVCPVCPVSNIVSPRQESCPPCPACARCPEPSFTCKKVPNYNVIDNEYLPSPVLNDFSNFGM